MNISHEPSCNMNLTGIPYIVFIACHSLSSVVALTGNGLVLMTIYKSRALYTPSNMFIASLAAADALVGLIINPLYIALTTTNTWVSPNPLYKFENYMWMQTLATTSFSLSAISVDRFFAVLFPFQYRKSVNKRISWKIILSIWIFSFLYAMISVVVDYSDDSKLWLSSLVITFILPCIVMICCNVSVYVKARSQVDKIRFSSRFCTTEAVKNIKNQKASCTIGIIISFFILLFSPNLIFSIIEYATVDSCEKLYIYQLWLWGIFIAYSSSAVNPFVYAVRTRALRKACLRVVSDSFSKKNERYFYRNAAKNVNYEKGSENLSITKELKEYNTPFWIPKFAYRASLSCRRHFVVGSDY